MTRELYEFRDLIADQCLDVLQPDAALVGGITGLRTVAYMAQEHNLVFTPHTWTNGMGVMANAHLVCGTTEGVFLEFPFDPPEWGLDRRDYMMAEPLRVNSDGYIVMPSQAGLGYALDEDKARRYTHLISMFFMRHIAHATVRFSIPIQNVFVRYLYK